MGKLKMSKGLVKKMLIPLFFAVFLITFILWNFSTSTPYSSNTNSTNSTLAGTDVMHSLYWQDDVGLSSFIFSFDNCTGSFQNISSETIDNSKQYNQDGSPSIQKGSNVSGSVSNLNTLGDDLTYDTQEGIESSGNFYIFQRRPNSNNVTSNCTNPENSYNFDELLTTCNGTTDGDKGYWYNNTVVEEVGTINSAKFGVKLNSSGTISNDFYYIEYGFSAADKNCSNISTWYQITSNSMPGNTLTFYNTTNSTAIDWTKINNTCWRFRYDVTGQDDVFVINIDAFFVEVNYSSGTATYRTEVWHNSSTLDYSGQLNSINATVNFTTNATDTYSMQIYNWATSSWTQSGCDSGSVTANTPTKWWCNITSNPLQYNSSDNKIRIRINSTADSDQGTLKEDYVQYNIQYNQTEAWSNFTTRVNSTVGCTIRWKVYANDTDNNWNVSDEFTYETTAGDTTPPTWFNNWTSIPTYYDPNTQSIFNVTWSDDVDFNVSLIWLNSTICTNNCTMTNYAGNNWTYSAVLPAGDYQFRIYGNDSSGNWNSTDTYSFTLGKNISSCSVDLTPLSNIIYPNTTIATASVINGDYTSNITLLRNGTAVNSSTTLSYVIETTILGVGTYNYTAWIPESQNYSESRENKTLTVNKGALTGFVSVPATSYPNSMTISSSESKTGDADVNYTIYCNDTFINYSVGSAPSGSYQFGAGNYNCILNTTGGTFANWTANSSIASNSSMVNKGSPTSYIHLYIDNQTSNKTIDYPAIAEIRGNVSNIPGADDLILTLMRNNAIIDWGGLENGTNTTVDSTLLGNGTYVFLYNSSVGENWTSSSPVTLTLFVNKGQIPLYLEINGSKTSQSFIYENVTNTTGWSELGAGAKDVNISLYRNSISVGNETIVSDIKRYGVGSYIYVYNTSGGENYTSNSTSLTLTINTKAINIYLALNGTQSNRTYTYPEAINATAWKDSTFDDEGTITLLRNGSSKGSGNIVSENIILANGTYNYSTTFSATNYTAANILMNRFALVNKGTPDVKVYVENVASNGTYTYPHNVIITANSSITLTQPNFTLYVYNVTPSSPAYSVIVDSTGPNNPSGLPSTLFGTGTYQIAYNTTGNANWTSANNNSIHVIIYQNSTNPVDIYFVNASGTYMNQNITMNEGNWLNTTAKVIYSQSGNANLYENGIYVGTSVNRTTLVIGKHNYTSNVTGNANYSSNFTGAIYYVDVFDLTPPIFSNNQSLPVTIYTPIGYSNFSIDCYDNSGSVNPYLENNFTGSLVNTTMIYYSYPTYYYNSTPLAAGTYQFRFVANDSAGNVNATPVQTFTISKANITVNLYLNGTLNSNKTYTYPEALNATASASVLTPTLYRNGTSKGTNEQIILGNGTYPYKVNATGNANYTDNSTGITYYVVVNKGPTLIRLFLNNSENNRTYVVNEMANFIAYLNVTGKTIYLNSTYPGWLLITNSTSVIYNLTNLSTLGNVYNLTAYWNGDANYSSSSRTYFFNVTSTDFTPPTITIEHPSNQSFASTSIWVNVTLDETGSWCGRSMDGTANTTMSYVNSVWYNLTTGLSPGSHNVRVYCNDTSGNMGSSNIEYFTVDTEFPRFSNNISSLVTRYNSTRYSNFSVTWNDNSESVNAYLENNFTGEFANASMSGSYPTFYYNSTPLAAGTYQFRFVANDSAGNVNATPVQTFTISKADTLIRLYLNGTQSNRNYANYTAINITVALNVSDKIVSFETNISGWLPQSGTTPLKNATQKIYATAFGTIYNVTGWFAGDENFTSSNKTYFVNITPITITITSPENTSYTATSIWANVTLDGIGSWCGRSLDGGSNTTMSYANGIWYSQMTSLNLTNHRVRFYCNDTVGNMFSDEEFFKVTSPPVCDNDGTCESGETVSNCPNDCQGGGPDGGNQTQNQTINVISNYGNISVSINLINAGGYANITINRTTNVAIRNLLIYVINSTGSVSISIITLSGKPAEVAANVPAIVYQYINISKLRLTDANINRTVVEFEVGKPWIATNRINKTTISLYRYSSGVWNKISTTLFKEDADFVYYRSIFTGLSYFAIAGEQNLTENVTPQCPTIPAPTNWTECINENRTRNVYYCNATTNYTLGISTETIACQGPIIPPIIPPELILPILLVIIVVAVIIIVMSVLITRKPKQKVVLTRISKIIAGAKVGETVFTKVEVNPHAIGTPNVYKLEDDTGVIYGTSHELIDKGEYIVKGFVRKEDRKKSIEIEEVKHV